MLTKHAQYPPFRSELKEKFGYLSFNCCFINLDAVAIRLLKSGETVVILYRGAHKAGYIYEGEKLSDQQLFKVYSEAPDNYNELEQYEKALEGRIELLAPPKDNHVFISDREVQRK